VGSILADPANGTGSPPVREPGNPAPIGDNQPPEPTPLEAMTAHIDDLYLEASNWLDGEPISTPEQAEAVTKLKGMLAEAEREAEKMREAEKRPHLDAGKAVDAAWKPVKEKAAKAKSVANRALTPWLEAVEAENRRKALEAQRAADEAARRLREQAEKDRASSRLADEDVREQLEEEAEEAKRRAARLAKETATVRTEHGGAHLRTVWLVKVDDHRALLMHYLKNRPDVADELREWLANMAAKDVRAGIRHLDGCNIWHEKRAV
jgi:hypothetical protein